MGRLTRPSPAGTRRPQPNQCRHWLRKQGLLLLSRSSRPRVSNEPRPRPLRSQRSSPPSRDIRRWRSRVSRIFGDISVSAASCRPTTEKAPPPPRPPRPHQGHVAVSRRLDPSARVMGRRAVNRSSRRRRLMARRVVHRSSRRRRLMARRVVHRRSRRRRLTKTWMRNPCRSTLRFSWMSRNWTARSLNLSVLTQATPRPNERQKDRASAQTLDKGYRKLG
jgi:hypothetical protein